MHPCPRCGVAAFRDGRCHQCGFSDPRYAGVRVVTGQAASPGPPPQAEPAPIALDPSALIAIEDEGPSLPGFESTAYVPSAARGPAAPSPGDDDDNGDFVYQACPRCQTPQGNPPETFCGHCGYRLKRKLRARPGRAGESRSCRECGTPNPAGESVCVNCGFPLPSDG